MNSKLELFSRRQLLGLGLAWSGLALSDSSHFYPADPLINDLRSDPRFKEMLKRLNLPE